jgi:hypothetical protein
MWSRYGDRMTDKKWGIGRGRVDLDGERITVKESDDEDQIDVENGCVFVGGGCGGKPDGDCGG